MRKFLAVSTLTVVLGCPLVAATGTAPGSAFPPFPSNINLNSEFWSGWQAGMVTPILLPDLTMSDIWTYKAAVRVNEMPSHRIGPFFVINYNSGFDQAEEQAADYFWDTSPTSCHNVVCNLSANAKLHKRLAPHKVKHLDLVGKGVKGAIKVTYRGARVIL